MGKSKNDRYKDRKDLRRQSSKYNEESEEEQFDEKLIRKFEMPSNVKKYNK
jgi:hypothetical protein